MSVSVNEILENCSLDHGGSVAWGSPVPESRPGIYFVSSTPDPNEFVGRLRNYHADLDAISQLLVRCPTLSVDGSFATARQVADRISQFWIQDSPVVYIGRAGTSLAKRVNQYYTTSLGARSPHSGGWWLKTMAQIDQLYVHFSTTDDVIVMEQRAIDAFNASISPTQRHQLFDPERLAPFANVEVRKGIYKRHALANYKTTKGSPRLPQTMLPKKNPLPAKQPANSFQSGRGHIRVRSQQITAKDRQSSYLRVPSGSKYALPNRDCELSVRFRETSILAMWKVNGSRSGTIGLGNKVMKEIGTTGQPVMLDVLGSSVSIVE